MKIKTLIQIFFCLTLSFTSKGTSLDLESEFLNLITESIKKSMPIVESKRGFYELKTILLEINKVEEKIAESDEYISLKVFANIIDEEGERGLMVCDLDYLDGPVWKILSTECSIYEWENEPLIDEL